MKIAMHATVSERCGIAAYSTALTDALNGLPDTQVEITPIREGKRPPEEYQAIAEKLNAADVDVIHLQHEHSFWGGIMPKSSAFWEFRYLLKKPVVITAHTTYTVAEMLRVKTERRIPQRIAKEILIRRKSYTDSVETAPFSTALAIVHTEAARQELIGRGLKPNYVAVIPAGIPAPPFEGDADAFRRKHSLEGKFLLTIFGYIAPNKGYEVALPVLAELSENVVLVIAGGSRNDEMNYVLEKVNAEISSLGLEDRVVITGYLSDSELADAMAATDIALVPHTQATGSYSVAVPISYGKPVIASDMDCFTELNARQPCMEIFPNGDQAALSAKIRELMGNSTSRKELGRKAMAFANGRGSWKSSARLTRNMYERAIELYSPGNW